MVTELHVSWAVTEAAQLLASGASLDEAAVSRLGNRICQAADILHSWVLANGGKPVFDVKVQGAFVVPADNIYDLGRIIDQLRTYVETDYFFGVGIGIQESYNALRQAYRAGEPYAFYEEAAGAIGEDEKSADDPAHLDRELNDDPLEKAVNDGHDHWMPAEGSENPEQSEGGAQNPDGVAAPDPARDDANGGAVDGAPAQPELDDDEEKKQQDATKKMVIDALTGIKAQAAALHQLKQIKPEAFDAVKNIVQALVTMAQELAEARPETLEKSGAHFKKLRLPAPKVSPKGVRPPKYPDALASPASEAGTIKDGRIKVAPVDAASGQAKPQGWNQARAGMVVGPSGSAVSSREPNTE